VAVSGVEELAVEVMVAAAWVAVVMAVVGLAVGAWAAVEMEEVAVVAVAVAVWVEEGTDWVVMVEEGRVVGGTEVVAEAEGTEALEAVERIVRCPLQTSNCVQCKYRFQGT
jgi:hypothetical protein